MTKFNPKKYINKIRIERAVAKNPGISKIWVWNENTLEYQPPERGKTFLATRKRSTALKTVEEKRAFLSLDEARKWRTASVAEKDLSFTSESPSFAAVVQEYRRKRFPQLRQSTQDSYETMLGKFFSPLLKIQISCIAPNVIDEWIEWLKSLSVTNRRSSFRHEFDLLSGILNFYKEYDDRFLSPVRPRHRKNLRIKSVFGIKNKSLKESEFLKFREALMNGPNSDLFATLATVQFYQALRISEAAGLHWEDIQMNIDELESSTIHVSKSIHFSRKKGVASSLAHSFKNSTANDGMKVAPILKESGTSLLNYKSQFPNASGLIFTQPNGEILTYRQIQFAYDNAFKNAGLPYTGTHIMRHGGASNIYNKTNGDLSMVQAITGNRDMKSALVYAHRDSSALKEFARKDWATK